MTHAEICPVCGGTGMVKKKIELGSATTTDATRETTCHGCNGRGWIAVGEARDPHEHWHPGMWQRQPDWPYYPQIWVIDYGQYTSDGRPMVTY